MHPVLIRAWSYKGSSILGAACCARFFGNFTPFGLERQCGRYPLLAFSLIVLALLPPIASAQEESMESQVSAVDLSSPRATMRSFFNAMGAVRIGSAERLVDAVACLYVGEDLSDEEQQDKAVRAADRLYNILDTITFEIDEIPLETTGVIHTVEFGSGGKSVTLIFHRYEDGLWRINLETLEEGNLSTILLAVTESEVSITEDIGPPFNERLKSPRAALRTFISGWNEVDGLTREDALFALDLSGLAVNVRLEQGNIFAHKLKYVIDRTKFVEYSEITPESEREAYTFLSDPVGNLVLDIFTDEESNERTWKFTQASLEKLEALYTKYWEAPVVAGVVERVNGIPLSIQVRDWMRAHLPFLLQESLYLQNGQWLGLFAVILSGMVVSRLFAFVLIRLIRRWFQRERFSLEVKLEKNFIRPIRIALMAWFWLLGLTLLGLPADVLSYLKIAAQVVTAGGAVWAFYRLIDIVGKFMAEKAALSESKFDDLLVPIVMRSLKIFVAVFGIVFVAENAGYQPSSILAGLGLGGLAFALAARDVVANIFGSMTILLDRPFEIGDWITIGDIDGNVESVGIRSTRVRTFYNSLITVPNSEVTNKTIDNMGARRYRRIKTMVSITYGTPSETIEAFCEGIRELVRKHPYTRKDYYHVYLNKFSASSLDILLYCFVETPEWGTELREKHRLFADIIRLAERLGVEFAFPTQTLYMRKEETPLQAAPATPDEALLLGRCEADTIVRELLGGEGKVPPPVTYGSPHLDERQTGDEDSE